MRFIPAVATFVLLTAVAPVSGVVAQDSAESPARSQTPVWIGAAAGALVGLATYEIGAATVSLCDASEPTCDVSPGRTALMVGGALLGAMVGLLVRGGDSGEAVTPSPLRLYPTTDGWTASLSLRLP